MAIKDKKNSDNKIASDNIDLGNNKKNKFLNKQKIRINNLNIFYLSNE